MINIGNSTPDKEVRRLVQKLRDFFNTYPLGVAGRVLYYDKELKCLILAIHTTGAEKTQEIAQKVWEDIPERIKDDLEQSKIGFAVKQI